MTKKDVKKNLLNHSEAKVRLLGEYLKRYLNIICNDGYTKRIKIFDLFCGEGLYELGSEGSPLVMMQQINGIHFVIVAKKTITLMEPNWVLVIQEQCEKADVRFFFKQWGGRNKKAAGRVLNGRKYDDMSEIKIQRII